MSHISTHLLTRSAAATGAAVACALGTPLIAAHARTFEFNSARTMIQQPLPSHWWCAEKRALLDLNVRCNAAAPAVAPRRAEAQSEKKWR